MRSAVAYHCLGFLALSACASAPGYRSSSIQPPASFRATTDSGGTAPAPYLATAASPALTAPPPDRPDRAGGSSAYWEQLGDTTLSGLIGEVVRANLHVRPPRAPVRDRRTA